MMRIPLRTLLIGVGVLTSAVAISWALDAAIVTDEEQLEPLLETISGRIDASRIESALGFTAPTIQPIEVVVRGESELYDADNADELGRRARRRLRVLQGDTLRTLRSSIEVLGDEATVSTQVLSGRGLAHVELRLRRHDERWLISRVRVSR